MIPSTAVEAEIERARLNHMRMFHGEGISLPANWRDGIKFDFGDCQHTVETIIEIDAVRYVYHPPDGQHPMGRTEEVGVGKWGLAICTRCGNVNTKECPHVNCEWQFDGKLLVCLNCGVDAT